MRENRLHGSEGGEAQAFPTPILMSAFLRLLSVPCNPPALPSQSDSRLGRLPGGLAPQGALAFMVGRA